MFSEEQKNRFFKNCADKALMGKMPMEKPKFVCLLGAKGSGKTTLGRKLNNTVLVSADDVINDFIKFKGLDGRHYVYGEKERQIFTEAVNHVFVAAIQKKLNIAYDTGLTNHTEELMRRMQKKGYHSCIKAILVDDIVAQLNVAERKLNFDRRFGDYKRGLAPYPEGLNPTLVDMNLAEKSATDTAEFLMTTSEQFEVYEYGSDKPAYDTQTAKQPFGEYLADFCQRLPDPKIYQKDIVSLYQVAKRQKNEPIAQGLVGLHQKLFGGKIMLPLGKIKDAKSMARACGA